MIIFVKVVFNLVLSISKTHLIVKLETFPHLRRARAGFGWGRGAVRPPPNTIEAELVSVKEDNSQEGSENLSGGN